VVYLLPCQIDLDLYGFHKDEPLFRYLVSMSKRNEVKMKPNDSVFRYLCLFIRGAAILLIAGVLSPQEARLAHASDLASGSHIPVSYQAGEHPLPSTTGLSQPTVFASAIRLAAGESSPHSILIDTSAGYAYIGTFTVPAEIVKLRLSDSSRAGVLQLPAGDGSLGAGAIDPAGGYAYFSGGQVDGNSASRVIRIRLSDFTRVDTLTLDTNEMGASIILIDKANDLMYLAERGFPDRIVKVSLSNFARIGYIELKGPGPDQFILQVQAGALDLAHGMAYFSSHGIFRMAAVRLSDFSVVQEKLMDSTVFAPDAAVFDTAAGYAYVAVRSNNELDPNGDQIVKIRLSDLTEISRLDLLPGEKGMTTAQIDPAAGFAYFGSGSTPGKVVLIRLSDFSRVDGFTLNTGQNVLISSALDRSAGNLYLGTETDPGQIVRVRLSDFTPTGSIQLRKAERNVMTSVIDYGSGFAYFGVADTPGMIVKVQLSNFSRLGTLILHPEEMVMSGVIDTQAGFAYFGTAVTPARVVKVRLSDFSRVGSITLNPDEGRLATALIDPSRGYAYFGTSAEPGKVVRVRLSDFSRLDSLTFNPGEA